ncbi:MAG: hypothetical protein HDT06_04410 [Bacteroidales bacterium]|nr:hypothetical protein [Bacteroidales bacterium]
MVTQIVVPVAICVVLPVTVVWLTTRMKMNNDKLRSEVLIKAIETNKDIDADKLAEALARPAKTERDVLFSRLKRGVLFSVLAVLCTILAIVVYLTDFESNAQNVLALVAAGSYAIGIGNLVVYFVSKPHILGEENKSAEE